MPWRMIRKRWLSVAGLVMVAIITLAAVAAPLIAPYDPYQRNMAERHQPPSREHPLGTDFYGRDVLSRIIFGARISLALALAVAIIRASVGVPLGLLAGYYGGWVDSLIMRAADCFMVLPSIILAIAVMAIRGPGLGNLLIALSLYGWPTFARLARAEVLVLREQAFIEAVKAAGARDIRILARHLLPNIAPTLLVYLTLVLPLPILAESSLSFLGLGLPPPTPSWGLMVAEDRGFMLFAWWSVTFPGLAIALTVLALNLLGDGLRDILDPRLRGE